MKIKIKLYDGAKIPESKAGGWFDIFMPTDGQLEGPYANVLTKNRTRRNIEYPTKLVSLGFAMELPKGFEAIIAPRSSTYKNFKCNIVNNLGIIEDTYKGEDDIWKANIISYTDTEWKAGDRLFQFRIQLAQKATVWQKIKWLFWNGKVTFVPVESLGNQNRGGFGSTGIN